MPSLLKRGLLDQSLIVDLLRRSFWFLPLAAMLIGGGLGFVVPMLDSASGGEVGIFTTSDFDSARGLLATIATATLSVAGITFSVTVIALQLASQQLGPRVLRNFQTDRLNQTTLAVFLGLFVYSLIALGRLSTISLGEGGSGPNLVLTLGVAAAVAALVLFAAFIQNIIVSLQASTVIRRIADDGVECGRSPYPSGFGQEADGPEPEFDGVTAAPIKARCAGFLNSFPVEPTLEAAASADGLIVQRVAIGDYVIEGKVLAEAYAPGGDAEQIAERAGDGVEVGTERTLVQDVAFPIRQLADVALRSLSPSLNDPTTAENAMGAMTHVLREFARHDPVVRRRADGDGVLRFVASAPDLDDLVRLGFEQVRGHVDEQPEVRARLESLLSQLRETAVERGGPTAEIDRQLKLFGSL